MDIAKKRQLLKILMITFFIGAGISLIGIISTASQYTKSKAEYAKLEEFVTVDTSNEPAAVEKQEEEIVEEAPKLINIDFDMDFDALKSINSDLIGWIFYEPLDLSYPVVIDKGDDYYEHYTFENERNVTGAIFMDYICKSDLSSFNTIIYGHNMRNGTMFGSLNELINDNSIIEENPYFYVFTKDDALMYKIVSAYYADSKSETYNIDVDYDEYDKRAYLDYMDSVSLYRDDEFFNSEFDEDIKICTLSTCHGVHSTTRTVIHGVLIAREPR